MTSQYLAYSNIEKIEDTLKEALAQYGIHSDISNKDSLKNLIESYGVKVRVMTSFSDLREDQWQEWFDLTRAHQDKIGLDQTSISPEETDRQAEEFFVDFDGSISDAKAALFGGELCVKLGIPEEEQESSFQNATLQGAQGIAISVATQVPFGDEETETGIAEKLRNDLAPLCSKGYSFEIQIGQERES